MSSRLLVVEDDPILRAALSQALRSGGYQVESAENGGKALEKACQAPFELIISDIRMPGMDGVSAMTHMKEIFPHLKTILITGYSDDEPIIRALNVGVDGILKKPFGLKELLRMVSLKLGEREKEKEQERLYQEREETYRQLLSKMAGKLGLDSPEKLLEEEMPLPFSSSTEETRKGTSLAELGRMAEMRQETDVAIQAYEEALQSFAAGGRNLPNEQFPIRLALSHLFYRKGEMELAILHGNEAMEFARQLKQPMLLVDALHHLAKIFLLIEPEKSSRFLEEVKVHLPDERHPERKAFFHLLSARLFLEKQDWEEAKLSIYDFLSLGKRHFLPKLLVSLQEIALPGILFALEERILPENVAWLLEESAPFLQDQLSGFAGRTSTLRERLSPYLFTPEFGDQHELQVIAFGKLLMLLRGKPVTENHWKSQKGRSLFLYLLYQHPKLVSKENLLDLFWPQLDVEKGEHAFRTTLYFIRRTLSEETPEKKNLFVYHEKEKFGIRREAALACDFLRFRNYHQQAKSDWEKGEQERAIFAMREAERLYKGVFLQGWSDEWSLLARENFQEAYNWINLAFTRYLRKQEAWEEALVYAKKTVALDPVSEESHYSLMECYLGSGRRDEAVRQYHLCCDILKKELSVSASDRLRSLYNKAIDSLSVPAG